MTMQIPESNILTTERLGKVFDTTTATYKFFWFLSIMQIHARTGNLRIEVSDIVVYMVANAWYPVHYFRLSFGKMDSLYKIVLDIQHATKISIDSNFDTLVDQLKMAYTEPVIKKMLKSLTAYVPYRFLHPWIASDNHKEIILRSNSFENACLYSIYKGKDEFYIQLNPLWNTYLHKHYEILTSFVYWNLTLFLQAKNPNVPAIPNKLIKPQIRNSLSTQHKFWDKMIPLMGAVRCIYTGKELHPCDYDLDHFIPWSFVSHDLLWNLIPADSSINSSKSNKLPDLDFYLPKLADLQHRALHAAIQSSKTPKILEDYLSLGYTPYELVNMDKEHFLHVFQRTFNPISQIAQNMGFETWKK